MKKTIAILCLLFTHAFTSTITNKEELEILKETCKFTSQCLSNLPSHRTIQSQKLIWLAPKTLSKNIELTLEHALLNNPTESEKRIFFALCKKLNRYQAILSQYAYAQSLQ